MNVWWLAINAKTTSYLELKHRKVVAQGWPGTGDLTALCRFIPNHRNYFDTAVQMFGDVAYRQHHWWHRDRVESRTPTVLWNLLNLRRGDLLVGIEGTTVRGICEMPADGCDSYRYDGAYDYAHTVGHPVEWTDWDPQQLGPPPTAPNQSVNGLSKVQKERAAVIAARRSIQP